MADLGNLWFSLGLDDSKFDKEWQKAFQKYKDDAKIDVRLNITKEQIKNLNDVSSVLSKFSGISGKKKAKIDIEITPRTLEAIKALKDMGISKDQLTNIQNAAKAMEASAKSAAKTNNEFVEGNKKIVKGYNEQALWLQNLSSLASNYLSLYAIKNFANEIANVTGEFEKQRITLQAMIGEMEGLDIYNQMKALSVESPFQFKDLASYAKQLAAFSVPYEELYDTTKRLADVSAGLGVDMSRIILAYGQIKSAGVLRGTELRQLTEAGVPILEELQERFSQLEGTAVSVGEIFGKISQKMVPFEMVKDVFKELTSEGGKFYEMQEIQAETLSGKISNLKDAYDIMLTEIGESTYPLLSGSVEFLYKLIENWEKVGKVVTSVAVAYGAFQIAHMVAFAAQKLNLVIQFTAAFFRLGGSISKAAEAVSAIGAVTKAGAWGVLIGAIVGIGTYFLSASAAAKRFNNELQKMIGNEALNLDNEIEALENLTRAIEQTTEGTESRRRAIDEYNNRFGQYLNNLYDEKTALEAIAEGNKKVKQSMSDRYKEEAVLQAKQKVEDEFGKDIKKIETKYIKDLKSIGLRGYSASAIAAIKDILKEDANISLNTIRVKFWDIFGVNTGNDLANAFSTYLDDYKGEFVEFSTAMKDALQDVDDAFNLSVYNSWVIREKYSELAKEHSANLEKIRGENKAGSKELADAEKNEEIRYLEQLVELYADMPRELKKYETALNALKNTTKTWKDEVKDIFANRGVSEGFAPLKDDSFLGYIDKIQEDYKKITASLKNLNVKDYDKVKPALIARKEAYEELARMWGIKLDEKSDNKAAQKRLQELRAEYNSLKAAFENYNDLIKNFGSREAVELMGLGPNKNIFYNKIKNALSTDGGVEEFFQSEFERIQEDAKREGGEMGAILANNIAEGLKKGEYKTTDEFIKILENVQKELKKWGTEDFTLVGTGIAFDVSKIVQDYTVAENQIAERKRKLLEMLDQAERGDIQAQAALRMKFGADWAAEAKRNITNLAKLERENNKKTAQERINDLAKSFGSDLMQKEIVGEGFMQSLGDKVQSQLKEALGKLESYDFSGEYFKSLMSDEDYNKFLKNLADAGLTLDVFIKKVKEYIELQGKDIEGQIYKNAKKEIKDVGKALLGTIDSLRQLAGDDDIFSGLLDGLETGVDAARNLVGAFKFEKDKDGIMKLVDVNWGNIAMAVTSVVSGVISAIAASREYERQMKLANDQFTNSVIEAGRAAKITGEQFETIFGENVLSALKADSDAVSQIMKELNSASKKVSNMKIKTKKGFWGIGVKYTTLHDLAPQLFKADGSVNYEYLDEFLAAYGDKMSESQKSLLEHLQATYEQYQDAMTDINNYLSDIFSDTATTITDRMVEAFAVTGNAATELGDLVNGIASQMAKDLIQSLLIDQYLGPTIERVKSLYNPEHEAYEDDPSVRIQKSILAMQEGLSAAETSAAEVTKILQGLADYGIDFSTESEKASDVLSGLTEAQQNLLMGYINGIRADVSYNKGMMTSIVNSVGTISNNIATAIVVWKQIEANTHRSADGVDKIIGFFESVMGPYDGGSGQAFKVNMA